MNDVRVNKDVCIGCGACASMVPDVFEIEDDGLATVIVDSIPKDLEEEVKDAALGCPTNAIEMDNEDLNKAA